MTRQLRVVAESGGGRTKPIHFERPELLRLLQLYSRRVADGEWRDYAIGQAAGRAIFAVFRHAFDKPLYTITKGSKAGFEVFSGPRRLAQAETLEKVLAIFEKKLRVVH